MFKKRGILLPAIVLYLATTGLSFLFFTKTGLSQSLTSPTPGPEVGKNGELVFDESLPKTEPCPLNGAKYSKQQKSWWEKQRPLGIMIENHENARPQSGLTSADVVYEVVAEGGITRFLTLFYCQAPAQVGPIRSARTYFLDFVSEYGDSPVYVHVGGANTPGPADALSQISDYGWTGYNDFNQFSIGFPTFWRDYNRLGHSTATEHTMYSTTDKLWKFAEGRKLTNKGKNGTSWDEGFREYAFKDDAKAGERGKAQNIHIEFWSSNSDYFVDWSYNPDTNLYNRKNGGAAHVDKNNNKQIAPKNVAILFMRESNANDGYEGNVHLLYGTKGSGKAIVLMDGKKIQGTWKKSSREGRTLLYDSKGSEIQFNRGQIWFEILPTDGVVR